MKSGLLFLLLLVPTAQARWHKPPAIDCGKLYKTTYGPTPREEEQLANGDSFFEIHTAYPGKADELSKDVLQKLKDEPVPFRAGSRTKAELTTDEMAQLFADIKNNPQVKETLCGDRYKNSERKGFCFAQSIAAHLKALQAGVNNKSIRKLWAVGRLEMGDEEWGYHATTIVRGKGGKWFSLDPFFDKPMALEEWYQTMREEHNPSKTMRLFATPAKQFGRSKKYNHADFSRRVFNGFFDDLLEEIRKTNRVKGEPRPLQDTIKAENEFASKWLLGGGAAAGGVTAAGMYQLYLMNQEKPKN